MKLLIDELAKKLVICHFPFSSPIQKFYYDSGLGKSEELERKYETIYLYRNHTHFCKYLNIGLSF